MKENAAVSTKKSATRRDGDRDGVLRCGGRRAGALPAADRRVDPPLEEEAGPRRVDLVLLFELLSPGGVT
jgi:hypothetical protein